MVVIPIKIPYTHFPPCVVGLVRGSAATKKAPNSSPPANRCHSAEPYRPGSKPCKTAWRVNAEPRIATTVRQLATRVITKIKPPKRIIGPEVSPELPGTLPNTKCEVSSKCPSFACIRGVASHTASGVVEVAYCSRRPVNPFPASVQQVPIHNGKATARINLPTIAG